MVVGTTANGYRFPFCFKYIINQMNITVLTVNVHGVSLMKMF